MPTPLFDQAINEILANLAPQQKTCSQCQVVFDIFGEDIDFYKIFRVPPPTLCPACRLQKRLGYRINFLPIFYKKTCSAPGHNEKVISFYSEQNPVKIYDYDYWYFDKWEPLDYGRDYDFQKPFFEQFRDFIMACPHPSLYKDPKGVNSDYVVSGLSPKNCYYTAVPIRSEEIYYSSMTWDCKNCLDAIEIKNCENCYNTANLYRCYNCFYCYCSVECLDSYFLFDCRNCSHCFGCVNLRNKQYYFFNQPLTKEQYEAKMKGINLGDRKVFQDQQIRFFELLSRAIYKNVSFLKVSNCIGNDLGECKNCFYGFTCIGCEDSRYIFGVEKNKHSMDFYGGTDDSYIYESTGIAFSNNIKFSLQSRYSMALEYCYECRYCQDCFACFGLRNKKFCIFNKQYSPSDYWQLLDKIKTQMLKTGEYGQFLPLTISWVPYNDSGANIEFPLAQDDIKKRAWHWQDDVQSDIDFTQFQIIKAIDLPNDIKDADDEILNRVILCAKTQKPFRLIRFELDFYRKHNLPLPQEHPIERIRERMVKWRRFFRLWRYPCSKCAKPMDSGWDPAKKYKVYCESCYLNEVV